MTNKIIDGKYEIKHKLGSGMGGTVFLAYHRNLKTDVVLKRISSEVQDLLDNRTEIDILKRLKHRSLPQVLDFIQDREEDGTVTVYTAMEFIPGKSFKDLLNDGRKFTPNEVEKYMRQLVDVVDYLHRQAVPIIHGDIKPANVMLTPSGDICLIDFNVSFFADKRNLTGYTKGYAAPEQVMAVEGTLSREVETVAEDDDFDPTVINKKDDDDDFDPTVLNNKNRMAASPAVQQPAQSVLAVDGRMDIYSIGATMYALLTGNKPSGDYKDITPISKTGIKMSDGLSYVIETAMQLKPEDRFQSAYEMLKAIDNIGPNDHRYKNFVRMYILKCVLLLVMMFSFVGMALYGHSIRLMEQADDHYLELIDLYNQGRFEEVLSHISVDDNAAVDRPEVVVAQAYLIGAESCVELGDFEQALQFYEVAMELGATQGKIPPNYAICLAYAGEYEKSLEAVEALEAAGEVETDYILLIQGQLAASKGEYNVARQCFEECIDISEDSYVLASTYAAYYELNMAQPNYASNLNLIQKNIDMLTDATERLEEQYVPLMLVGLSNVYIEKARVTGNNSNYDYAISALQKIKDMGWATFDTHMNLAYAYTEAGYYSQGKTEYLNVLDTYGEHYSVYKKLAFVELKTQASYDVQNRDYRQFKEYYDKCFEIGPQYGEEYNKDMELGLLQNTYKTLVDYGWL